MADCSVVDCDDPARIRGWCQKHYARWKRHGDLTPPTRTRVEKPACAIPGCESPAFCRTWCRKHYTRWYETGSTELGVRNAPAPPPRPRVTALDERFWAKVDKSGECWLWTGGKSSAGYGLVWAGPGQPRVGAHRAAWELAHQQAIPDGMQIDHLCRVLACVRPEHLEVVTPSANTTRGYAPSLGASHQLAKTHCPQGHAYSSSNTYVNRKGARMCRTCIRVRSAAHRQARRDGVPYVDPFVRHRSS